jgi:hypothetical protein
MGMIAWAAECSGRGVAAAGRRGYASSAGYYKEAYQVGPNTVPVPPHPVSRPMQVDTLALVRWPHAFPLMMPTRIAFQIRSPECLSTTRVGSDVDGATGCARTIAMAGGTDPGGECAPCCCCQARQFKAAGVEPAQAEAITRVMSEMMDQLATTMGQLYVCKMELEKVSCHRPHSHPRTHTARCHDVAILAHATAHSDQRLCRSSASRFWWLTGSVEGCGGRGCGASGEHQARLGAGALQA